MTVHEQLLAIALERGLRQSTVISYERLLKRLGLLSMNVSDVLQSDVTERLWTIDNPNTRRAAVIALRSVFGWSIKIPRAIPRRYDLPDEDTLRLALMTTPHEPRGLLMMYAGLRIGEACAITLSDVSSDRLRVDKQVQQLHRTGKPTVTRTGPVKTGEADVVIPHWLTNVVLSLTATAKPDAVRESLRRAGQKVGIRLNPHMLRHWYATTLLERGVPLSVVSEQMRHSDPAVTLRTYSQSKASKSIHDTFG
ncbi:tyrosine-type recombinase/integrase [Nocardioides halotolerans]|uniref:tyrosine-type recombinase/integrase n=1 Tax=Nocardioides halotolerans TaxID=433660 RepID=UPI00068550E5|nr:site-specific integrase [Nocardioides halotolerans]